LKFQTQLLSFKKFDRNRICIHQFSINISYKSTEVIKLITTLLC